MWNATKWIAAYASGADKVVKRDGNGEASPSTSYSSVGRKGSMSREWSEMQREKLLKVLNKSVVSIEDLQQVSWGGIPQDLRPICWQLMLGYLPRETSSWQDVVNCKRKAYRDLLKTHYEVSNSRKR